MKKLTLVIHTEEEQHRISLVVRFVVKMLKAKQIDIINENVKNQSVKYS